jgi:hypothetical protein
MESLPDAFMAVLRPVREAAGHQADCACRTCKPRARIDDEEFARGLMRMLRAWEARVIENPEMLPVHLELQARCVEIVNVAIAVNAERYAIDPAAGASMAECARILGISKPSASERKARGIAIMGDRVDRAGAAKFAEAKRERERIAAAHEAAVDELAAWRARRANVA